MVATSSFAGARKRFGDIFFELNPSAVGTWLCNVAAWVALVARVHEPVTVVLAVMTGWCAFEGLRLRSFPLVVVSLVNTLWLLA